jgi:hypothetical protein
MVFLNAISGELEFNEPAFGRHRDGLRAIISAQLGKDVPDWSFYGIFGDLRCFRAHEHSLPSSNQLLLSPGPADRRPARVSLGRVN